MSQRQQLERILLIDRSIRANQYPNADRMAQKLEVSRRVIFMDRKFMMDRLQAPIAYDRKRQGWHYTEPTWMLPSTMIAEGDLLAFVLSVEVARRYVGTALEAPLASAVAKIAQSLHGPVAINLQELGQHCTFDRPPSIETNEATLLALHRAIRDSHPVRVRYHTAENNTRSERILDPYHLHHAQGNWYVIAHDHRRHRILTFHVGRIESLSVLPQHFQRDVEFDAEQWVHHLFHVEAGDAVMNVAIRFDAYQATFMRDRVWHSTQAIEALPDGGIILRFQSSSWGEITRFVLQYGSHAELLEPPELRAEIAQEAQRTSSIYAAVEVNQK